MVDSRCLEERKGCVSFHRAVISYMSHLRDNEQCASLADTSDVLLDLLLRMRVEGRGGFIQHDNSRIFENGTGNGHSLLLTAAESETSLSNLGVVTIGE